jgi:hypothetical protein
MRIHAPRYVFLGVLLFVAVLVVLICAAQGWWAFVLPAIAVLMVGGYFGALSLWAAYVQYDVRPHLDHHMLFNLGGLQPTDRCVHVNLGSRVTARGLARRLTGGHITVVDVYNPRLTPRPEIVRLRRMAGRPPVDPRLTFWRAALTCCPCRIGVCRWQPSAGF